MSNLAYMEVTVKAGDKTLSVRHDGKIFFNGAPLKRPELLVDGRSIHARFIEILEDISDIQKEEE